jgi:hypothetical protein
MPPKRSFSSRKLVEQEGRIEIAISALKNNEIQSIRRAAEIYKLPKSTLYDRVNGQQFRVNLRANSHRLSKTQEEALVNWIVSMDTRGVAPRHFEVAEMANIILQTENPTEYKPVGPNWVTNFTKRRPELKSRFARRYNHQRAKCENPKIISGWFDMLQQTRL